MHKIVATVEPGPCDRLFQGDYQYQQLMSDMRRSFRPLRDLYVALARPALSDSEKSSVTGPVSCQIDHQS